MKSRSVESFLSCLVNGTSMFRERIPAYQLQRGKSKRKLLDFFGWFPKHISLTIVWNLCHPSQGWVQGMKGYCQDVD